MTRRITRRPEEDLQRACVEYLRLCVPPPPGGPFWFHVPNQRGTRTIYEAQILKALGVRAGVPDLIVCWRGRFLAIELKAPRGRVSETQAETQASIAAAGGETHLCRSVDDLIASLRSWGVPTRESARRAAA